MPQIKQKLIRLWHGKSPEHPSLCERCIALSIAFNQTRFNSGHLNATLNQLAVEARNRRMANN